MSSLIRAGVVRGYDRGDSLTLLGDDGLTRTLEGDSAALVRSILDFLVLPRSRAELAAHLGELAGAPVEIAGAVAEALDMLRASGAVREIAERGAPRPSETHRPVRLVLALTGGVASMYAPLLIEMLQRRGFEVRVAATPNALRFVSPLALEALTHQPVASELWPKDARVPVPHLDLATWAEIVVVYPASATSLSRIARGSCSTLVSAIAISTRAPAVIVPSMNERMYSAPSVQRNLATLRDDGFHVVLPACGYEVADRPDRRPPMYGAAPPLEAVVAVISSIAERHVVREAKATPWDEVYAASPIEELPWFTPTIDPDIAALLDRLVPAASGRFLDLGTGPGTVAIEAARRGFGVVATDVSPRALDFAQRRAGALPIAWVTDDAAASRLAGSFDVVHDRGCLHVLPLDRHPAYAATLARLTAPGGWVIVKTHSAAGPTDDLDLGTRRFAPADVASLLGEAFELVHSEETTFPGPGGRAPRALLCALRRA